MAQERMSLDGARKHAEAAGREVASHPWVQRLGRFGFAAKGVVYAIVGILAAQVAFGYGGQTTDSTGALQTIAGKSFGQFLMVLLAIGLVGYVIWRFLEGAVDPLHYGDDTKGWAKRIGAIFSSIAYAGVALSAIRIVLGAGQSAGNATQDWTAWLMQQPFGRWLVALGGAIVIGVAVAQFVSAYTKSFQQKFEQFEMSDTERKAMTRFGQAGHAARGVTFSIIGIFLIIAAWRYDANQVQGLDGALATLAQQPYGTWLLGIVSIGLICYGAYMLAMARYGKMAATSRRA